MKAAINIHGIFAGVLEKDGDGKYRFQYDQTYLAKQRACPASLTLPLQAEPYTSNNLFPFFAGLLSEGVLIF